MWQKARIIQSVYHPHLIGREVWLTGRPKMDGGLHLNTIGQWVEQSEPGISTNLIHPLDACQMMVKASTVELLPEFAETVDLVKWADFISEK